MAHFEINEEWVTELVASQPIGDMVAGIGEEILNRAKENAAESDDTEAFKESIKGLLHITSKGRPFFRVWSDDPGALSIEFGNSHQAPHRALGRAIDSV